jgi:integrase
VRPGELRSARWADIDLEAAEWRYTPPKTRNQSHVDFIVPLSQQALAVLQTMQTVNGRHEHVFYSLRQEVAICQKAQYWAHYGEWDTAARK